jgi:hypothetical protein
MVAVFYVAATRFGSGRAPRSARPAYLDVGGGAVGGVDRTAVAQPGGAGVQERQELGREWAFVRQDPPAGVRSW